MPNPIVIGVDEACGADTTIYAVVESVLDRWKMHDFWIVSFIAFDVYSGDSIHNQFFFDTAREAYKFKAGRAVTWRYDVIDCDDDELPF
ncbi:hypothetical protein WCT78_20080 [Pectobacterium versatile]|uniref:hypothetical protein n=1 Tax=Pectobacterium TaxID=122277 RepID=UPI0018E1D865|nr:MULTISPECIES: hypothetical protein [Pectobacterium]MBQ4791074.1 hypothetical protein [Pectobacterium versatile]QQA76198.1 hypothetical protein JBL47_00700 [Pectobacterium parmentieri]